MNRILFLLLIPVSIHAQSTDEVAIRDLSRKFSADYVKGDFQSMARCYSDDAILLAPGRDVIIGREAILDFWRGTSIPMSHESIPDRIVIENDVAHDYGYYYVQTKKSGEPLFSSKYYIRWVKGADGSWRMDLDMWNSRQSGWRR